MPRAEVGSSKHLANKLKSKGLGRLRWYCQICEKQCRDENGFKMHVQSESHVRQILNVGTGKNAIEDFSKQFERDFLQQLKTAHGTKSIQINHFYQEYIANKEHVHMNATKWTSLTQFAVYLGREGICRVEETDKGIQVAWIDNSPEALKRAEALRRKELQDKGDEEREQRLIREQIKRAQKERGINGEEDESEEKGLQRQEGEKIKLSFGAKPTPKHGEEISPSPALEEAQDSANGTAHKDASPGTAEDTPGEGAPTGNAEAGNADGAPKPVALKFGVKPQSKNVFALAKKNAFSGGKKPAKIEQPKKMSEAERIMREEMERKRTRETSGFGGPNKKQRH